MHLPSLRAPNPYPVPDAPELFQSNPPTGALRAGHYLLGNAVVLLAHHAPLSSTQAPQEPSRALAPLGLQPPPLAEAPLPDAQQLATAVLLAVAVGGDVDNPQVHTQVFIDGHGLRGGHLTADRQVELAAPKAEVRLPPLPLQPGQRRRRANIGDGLPSGHGPDAHPLLDQVEGEYPRIVGKGAALAEAALFLAACLVAVSHLGDGSNHHLRREVELAAARFVDQLVQGELLEGLFAEGGLADGVTALVGDGQGGQQAVELGRRGLELELRGQLHAHNYSTSVLICIGLNQPPMALPPRSRATGFPRREIL